MNSRWNAAQGLMIAMLLLALAKPSIGQPDAPALKTDTVVHAYDVRDFLLVVKNYPLTGDPVPLTRLGADP